MWSQVLTILTSMMMFLPTNKTFQTMRLMMKTRTKKLEFHLVMMIVRIKPFKRKRDSYSMCHRLNTVLSVMLVEHSAFWFQKLRLTILMKCTNMISILCGLMEEFLQTECKRWRVINERTIILGCTYLLIKIILEETWWKCSSISLKSTISFPKPGYYRLSWTILKRTLIHLVNQSKLSFLNLRQTAKDEVFSSQRTSKSIWKENSKTTLLRNILTNPIWSMVSNLISEFTYLFTV